MRWASRFSGAQRAASGSTYHSAHHSGSDVRPWIHPLTAAIFVSAVASSGAPSSVVVCPSTTTKSAPFLRSFQVSKASRMR